MLKATPLSELAATNLKTAIAVGICLFFTASAHAECESVRLDRPGWSMEQVRVSDQGSLPICYVYSATSLFEAFLRTEKVNISQPLNGLEIFRRIEKSNEYESIRSADTGRTCNVLKWLQEESRAKGQKNHIDDFTCADFGFELNEKTKRKELHTPNEFKAYVQNSLPLGIEYCSGVLSSQSEFIHNRSFRSNLDYLNTSDRSENLTSGCGFHASVLIGREKLPDGKCALIIQNSWGEYIGYPNRKNDHGKIWIPEDELSVNPLRVIEIN